MQYDLSKAKNLLSTVSHINSFDGVQEWDTNAQNEINSIMNFISNAKEHVTVIEKQLQEAKTKHEALPMLKKIFAGKQEQKDLHQNKATLEINIEKLFSIISDLQNWIEKTPNNIEEAKEMLKELKLIKKELATQKKEVNANMRDVRVTSRQKNSGISNQLFVSSKYKQIQRIGVRHEKEKALSSYEDMKSQLEYQIIEVEKMINWIEKICK